MGSKRDKRKKLKKRQQEEQQKLDDAKLEFSKVDKEEIERIRKMHRIQASQERINNSKKGSFSK